MSKIKRITIQFEEDTYKYLQERAKENRRQTSAELNTILEQLKANPTALDPIPETINRVFSRYYKIS